MSDYRAQIAGMAADPTRGIPWIDGFRAAQKRAAAVAAEADARIAELEAECARLRDTIQTLRGAIPDADELGTIAVFLTGSDVYSDSFLATRRHEMAQSLANMAARVRLQGGAK